MENFKGDSSLRNPGKQPYLPPKSPFPSIPAPVYGDFGSCGSREAPRLREVQRQHQRTSSESFLIEEQPLWLDDLLNEPEVPVKRSAHRRSSSDSFAFTDGVRIYSNYNNLAQEEWGQRTITSVPLWGSLELDLFKDVRHCYAEENTYSRPQNRVWMSGMSEGGSSSFLPSMKEKNMNPGSYGLTSKGIEVLTPSADEKLEQQESPEDSKGLLEKKDLVQYSQSETDSKRVKQQFAQRSRVRKLQYIAELEKRVQALQADGMEVSAELDFVDQQNLILSLENKALKQRLDSLAQEQLIKHLQKEMLEREIARLRVLFQQQQSPLQPPLSHDRRRSSSIRDLDSQFASISIKHKVVNSGRDPITGLRIH